MLKHFGSLSLLASRSPIQHTFTAVDIALRLAVRGRIAEAVRILELAYTYKPIRDRYLYNKGLHFAFEAAGAWPSFVSEEQKGEEYVGELERRGGVWGTMLGGWHRKSEGLGMEERDLRRVLRYLGVEVQVEAGVDDGEGGEDDDSDGDGGKKYVDSVGRFAYTCPWNEGQYMALSRSDAVCLALDMALRIPGYENVVSELAAIIRTDFATYWEKVALSRRAWQMLKDGGFVIKGDEEEDLQAEFERLEAVFEKRLRSGAQRPFKEKSISELLEILDENTAGHDDDEENDLYQMEDVLAKSRLLPNGRRTILHKPASQSSISDFERRLGTPLPSDLKELLVISDGMEGIWNGYYRHKSLTKLADMEIGLCPFGAGYEDEEFPLALITWEELPRDFDDLITWPNMRWADTVRINADPDEATVWLVKPKLMADAVGAFFEAWDAYGDVEGKMEVERCVGDYFGGLEALREVGGGGDGEGEGWGVVRWDAGGFPVEVWGSVRSFLEGLVVVSYGPS